MLAICNCENELKIIKIILQIIIKINNDDDLNISENILIEWISKKNTNENINLIFELMKNHEKSENWFSSLISFF